MAGNDSQHLLFQPCTNVHTEHKSTYPTEKYYMYADRQKYCRNCSLNAKKSLKFIIKKNRKNFQLTVDTVVSILDYEPDMRKMGIQKNI